MKFIKDNLIGIILGVLFIMILIIPINNTLLNGVLEKPETINNIYSILIGFIFTSLAILSSLKSKPLINLAKNGKSLGIIIRIFITLSFLFIVMIFPFISKNIKIYEYLLKISIFTFFNFTILMLQILNETIKHLPVEKSEEEKEKNEKKILMGKINDNLYSISVGINKIGDKIIKK
jgi:magnesium-transporting ATPase (P-type)